MNNLELMILCALRNIFFEVEYDNSFINNLVITPRMKRILQRDSTDLFKLSPNTMLEEYLTDKINNLQTASELNLSKDEINYFFLRAIKYTLPRQSYIVSVTRDWTKYDLDDLTKLIAVQYIRNHADYIADFNISEWNLIVDRLLKDLDIQ